MTDASEFTRTIEGDLEVLDSNGIYFFDVMVRNSAGRGKQSENVRK